MKKVIVLTWILNLVSNCVCVDIAYRYTDAYEIVWNQKGSGSHTSGSFWHVQNPEPQRFCSTGDAVANRWDIHQKKNSLLLTDVSRENNALVSPTGFTKIWSSSEGRGDAKDLTVYRMDAPSGYTCIGDVAVGSHSTKPDPKRYCCIKDAYLTEGAPKWTYADAGSNVNSNAVFYTVVRTGGNPFALNAGTFKSVTGMDYKKKDENPNNLRLLDGGDERVKDEWSMPGNGAIPKPINLYQVDSLTRTWADSGSGARYDVSLWKVESEKDDYYPIGKLFLLSSFELFDK